MVAALQLASPDSAGAYCLGPIEHTYYSSYVADERVYPQSNVCNNDTEYFGYARDNDFDGHHDYVKYNFAGWEYNIHPIHETHAWTFFYFNDSNNGAMWKSCEWESQWCKPWSGSQGY